MLPTGASGGLGMIGALSLSFPSWEMPRGGLIGCGVCSSSALPASTRPGERLCECEFRCPGKGA